MTDLVGQRLGNYRLMKLIGVGGFAEVYLGEHIHLETLAAIKVMHARSLLSQEDVNNFRKEARRAHLTHPHIVHVLDFGIEGQTPFLVMDYAPNGTLRLRHPRGIPLPIQVVVFYVLQIADALQYIHDQGMVHCDVKPENMLVGRNGEILLGDFGIAIVAQSSRLLSVQAMAGTIAYMAPEQIQEHPCPASDQYALGVVVYEWLTGVRPFSGSFFEIAAKHGTVYPVPLRVKVPTISPYIEEVVLTALAKKPQQRFANVKIFAHALEEAGRYVDAQPSVTSPRRFTPKLEPLVDASGRDHRVESSTLHNTPVTRQISLSRENYTVRMPLSPSSSHVNAGMVRGQIEGSNNSRSNENNVQPQQHKLITRRRVLVGSAGLVGVASLAVGGLWLAHFFEVPPHSVSASMPTPTPIATEVPLLLKTVTTYKGHKGPIYALAWSYDSSWIASGGGDNQVQIWMATNGKTRFVYKQHKGSVNTIGWSPDHNKPYLIATGGADQTIHLWDSSNQTPFFIYNQHQGNIRSLSWSPDGIFIASGDDEGSVHVWNTTTGRSTILSPGKTPIWTVAWSPDGRYIAWGGDDGMVHVWNVKQKKVNYGYKGHLGDNQQIPAAVARVKAIAWSPDSKQIASGSDDHTVHVWNINTERSLIYPRHGDTVNDVSWSSDGKYIASGGGDHQVHIWNPRTGGTACIYSMHQATLHAIAWSPDGLYGASGGDDNIVLIWKVV